MIIINKYLLSLRLPMALYILTLGIYYDYVYIWNHILYNLKKSNGFSKKYIYIYIYIYNGRFKCITNFFYSFFSFIQFIICFIEICKYLQKVYTKQNMHKGQVYFLFIYLFLYWVRHMISHVFSLFLWSQKCCRHLFGMATISKNFKCWQDCGEWKIEFKVKKTSI